MNGERDVTRVVRSWLNADEYDSADRVIEAVFATIDTTPQRRATWPAWRLPTMNMYAKLGAVAAAVALVAFIGYSFVSDGRGLGTPDPTTTPVPTPEPTVLTSASRQTLGPGTYRVEGDFARPFTFTIESEWILEHLGTDTVSLNRSLDPGADWLDIQLIENVYSDPCAGELTDPPVAKTPEDLIGALAGMTGFTADPITQVAIGAHAGSHVAVTNEMDGDADGCVEGNAIPIYTAVEYPDPAITNGNSRDEFWVVDVDGTPVIIHGLITRFADEAADVLESQQIVETIVFD